MSKHLNKSLASEYPNIAKEWHPTKNGSLTPVDVAPFSNKKVWWMCYKGHEWSAAISARTGKAHSGCPVCSNRILLAGFNDLESQNPELSKEWNYEKNGSLTPDCITATSAKKVWWTCDKNHDFLAKVYDRNVKGHNCPYCCNQAFKPEYNSVAVMDPQLAEEWDFKKNAPLTPFDVIYGGDNRYWWKCQEKPHSFLASVKNRRSGSSCPYCSSQLLLVGFNDLQTRRPDLLELWNYEKNTDITPQSVMEFSNKKVWWKCPDCGHEWQTKVNMVSIGTRCPKCTSVIRISEAEYLIAYYLGKFFSDVCISYHADWLGRKDIDIYIPSVKLAIEYDGVLWHNSKKDRDVNKSELIRKHGDLLIRFREYGLDEISDFSSKINVRIKNYNLSRLDDPLKEMFEIISKYLGTSIKPDIDASRDWKEALASNLSIKKERSLSEQYPEYAKSWNYEKNEGLVPEQFTPGSNKKVWWKCPDCGYEWEDIIANRVLKHRKCPSCNPLRHSLIVGKNDLVTMRPDLLEEWNYEKNQEIDPKRLTVGSTKKVWWKCRNCGHEWQSTVANRNTGYGCPKCGRIRAGKSLSKTNERKRQLSGQTSLFEREE